MGQFGNASILAAEICKKEGVCPEDAWKRACCEKINNLKSRKKGCPRAAFIGLVQAGLVHGCDVVENVRRKVEGKNGQYAVIAVQILRDDPQLASNKSALWKLVLRKLGLANDKTHNNQMDVVSALWDKGLIIKL